MFVCGVCMCVWCAFDVWGEVSGVVSGLWCSCVVCVVCGACCVACVCCVFLCGVCVNCACDSV